MILNAILVLGLFGFVFAALLALAADYFKVEEDPRVSAVLACLPGANCGACGSASCHNFAERVVSGEKQVNGCTVGGEVSAKKIAAIMGVDGFEVHKKIAAVHCGASDKQRRKTVQYNGVKRCTAADLIGGDISCGYGCLGHGDCFSVCGFDAIVMKDGLPKIDPEKCTACGKCVTACPRSIISLIPYDFQVIVACSSHDKGAVTRKVCPVGCIACKICEREAPGVFKVENNLAEIDYSQKGTDCSSAIAKCPTKCIVKL